jgi:hypothetical protein
VMRYARVKLTSTAALRQRDYINEREPFLWRIIHDLKAPLLIYNSTKRTCPTNQALTQASLQFRGVRGKRVSDD